MSKEPIPTSYRKQRSALRYLSPVLYVTGWAIWSIKTGQAMVLALAMALAFGLFFSYICHRRINGLEATLATTSIRQANSHLADFFDKSLMLYSMVFPAFFALAGLLFS